jgi:pimeloyl-ACP methyl ester carboxylesterase
LVVTEMSDASFTAGSLHVIERGRGYPLVLVHGFPLDHQMWQGQFPELSRDYRVIAPDLRGFGRSPDGAEAITMGQYADDLAGMLDQRGVDRPIALAGLSMGGYIAWEFWRRHPQRLSHLILCDTRSAADTPEAAEVRLQTAERVLAEGTGLLVESMLPKLFASGTRRQQPEVVRAVEQVIRSARPAGVAAALRGMAQRADATEWLGQIQVPTLFVCGQEDAITGVAEMAQMADAVPRAELVVIPACGHLAPLEDPLHVNKAIRGFLDRLT